MASKLIDPPLGNVSIKSNGPGKGEKLHVAYISINEVPMFFFHGETKDLALEKANSFYTKCIFEEPDSFDFNAESPQEKLLDSLRKKPKKGDIVVSEKPLPYFERRQAQEKKKTEGDGRKKFSEQKWMVKLLDNGVEDKHRVSPEHEEAMLAEGYIYGRKWEKIGKKGRKTEEEGYVHPLKDTLWINNGVNKYRCHKSELTGYIALGWREGMGEGSLALAAPPAAKNLPDSNEKETDTSSDEAEGDASSLIAPPPGTDSARIAA